MESFILLPIVTMSGVPMGNGMGLISQAALNIVASPSIVSAQKLNINAINAPKGTSATFVKLALNQAIDPTVLEAQNLKEEQAKADAIDDYFKSYNMPLAGQGMKMVQEAEKNNLDWRLLPAIAVIESTGGKFACKKVSHSFFGWGSCKISFDSKEKAIEVVARNLGGNNPNTAKHYEGKTTKQILQKYNPPSIVPTYAGKVMKVMDAIGDAEIKPLTPILANS